MTAQSANKQQNVFLKMHPLQRLLISVVLSTIIFFLFPKNESSLIKIVALWIVFSATYLTMCWIIFFTEPIAEIRKKASKQDGSKVFVFLMIMLSSCGSMISVLLLVISSDSKIENSILFVPATICGMILSWAMVHTLFTFHYARNYYGNDLDDETKPAGGLDFPGKNVKPDYIDFAYFAFVIGCTFQVSDVEISSRSIRRLAFLHQLISFGLNTFVVALTINLVASLHQ